MKKQLRLTLLLACGLAVSLTQAASARVISTFDPGGADSEVREAAPTTARGAMTELGMRSASAHNGHVYMKFGVQGVNAANLNHPITVRTTWALTNLNNARIEDEVDQVNATFADNPNVKFDYYVLNPNNPKANWDEATMVYGTTPVSWAPGLTFDGNFSTKDILVNAANFTYLGENELRSLNRKDIAGVITPVENRIPVGESFDLTFPVGSPLHTAIASAQATGHKTVTVMSTLQHVFDTAGISPDWINHNYVFNPKERNPLTTDTGYDNDNTDAIPSGPGPNSAAANTAANPFAPQLLFVPEPSSIVLLGLCGLSLLGRRRV
jgi:hypothetical protein